MTENDPRSLGGEEFFRHFVDTFAEATQTPETTPWLYSAKLKSGQRKLLTDSDWTPMIVAFLDLLAWRLGYVQFYEKPVEGGFGGPRDCVWVKRDSPGRCVAIEAENNARSTLKSEVPGLLTDSAPLKVLVTYDYPHPGETPDKWRRRFLPTLYRTITSESTIRGPYRRRPPGDLEFLLVLGKYGVEEHPRRWLGRSLSRTGGRWASDWATLQL